MFMQFVCVLFAIIAGAIIHWYITYNKWVKRIKGISGPKIAIPILGNALEFKGRTTLLDDILRLFRNYGNMVYLMVGYEPMVFLADKDVFEKVINSTIVEKAPIYRFLSNWLKMGLLLSSGAKWKTRRRIITPAYHFQILEEFIPIFERVGNILVDQLRKDKDLDAIDVYPYVSLCTLDVICETAMGVEINAQLNKQSEYATSVMQMGKIIMDRFIRPLEQSNWTYWLTENYRTERRCLKVIHGHTKSVIANRRHELELRNAKCTHEEDDDVGLKKKAAFLDLLLTAMVNGKPLTDDDIQEEVDTFMFAGHDTTASAISFALFSIATNTNVQAKLVAEQEEIFGEEKRNVTLTDLNKMQYLEMVIKETLRLYPSVPFIARQNKEDLNLGNGITIPRKTTLTMVIFEIQRDPKCFANPDKFDPDRFLTENYLRKQPFSYIPFSTGPRNCIGQKFAILEMKSIISKVLRTFVLSPTVRGHNLELIVESILRSANGMVIKIKERN